MTRAASRFLFWTLVAVVVVVAVWLFMDAITWISGRVRYTIFFERVFDTPESAASRMRWVQGIVAVVFGCVCLAMLRHFDRRAMRREISDDKTVA
jgi:hypothetical protein